MSNEMPVRVQRTNLVVADLERSLRLYRDILGFRVDFILGERGETYAYTVFQIPSQARTKFAALSSRGQERSLALTEVSGIELPEATLPSSHALVLEVDDFDDAVERSRAEGLHIFPEETLHTHDGRVGREIGMLDHDGHLVVLYRIQQAA
ncbi:VOC family protein [Candidatus Foliamicus sp.]